MTPEHDINDLTPEDAFGLDPHEREVIDRVHVNILRGINRYGDQHLDPAARFRRTCYDHLAQAESPEQLEAAGMVVIMDSGYLHDGPHRMLERERPRLLVPAAQLALGMLHAGDTDDEGGRHIVTRSARQPTSLCSSQWLELWGHMQNLVITDIALQAILIVSAAA